MVRHVVARIGKSMQACSGAERQGAVRLARIGKALQAGRGRAWQGMVWHDKAGEDWRGRDGYGAIR